MWFLALALSSLELPGDGGIRTVIHRHPDALKLGLGVNPVSPMNNNPKCGYIASVTVGTPPQEVKLLMDTGSANIFVGNFNCKECSQPLFQPKQSSSLSFDGEFNMYDWCKGVIGDDVIGLTPTAHVKGQKFGLCNTSDSCTMYNGIFGLGMRNLEVEKTKIVPPLTRLREQKLISKELFSVYLDNSEESKGEIQWGFVDKTKYTGNLTYHPMSPEKSGKNAGKNVYYKVDVDFVELGGLPIDNATVILTDTGAVGIYPPGPAALAKINKQIGAIKADCSNRDQLPDLTLTIDGTLYTIPSSIYVLRQKSGKKYTCFSAFMENGDDFWLMGDPFFRAVYAVFDVANMRYGMAPNINLQGL